MRDPLIDHTEIVHQPLYDIEPVGAFAPGAEWGGKEFFARPQSADKGPHATNLYFSGLLPPHCNFSIEGIGLRLLETELAVYEAFRAVASVELMIGQKSCFLLPGAECMAPSRIAPDYRDDAKEPFFFRLRVPLTLDDKNEFRVRVRWELRASVAEDASMGVLLDGRLFRPAQ